jgi:hypothetical protein
MEARYLRDIMEQFPDMKADLEEIANEREQIRLNADSH